MDKEDKICALCKWNKNVGGSFSCSNINQEDIELRHGTNYYDTCKLFEESEERKTMYDYLEKDFNK